MQQQFISQFMKYMRLFIGELFMLVDKPARIIKAGDMRYNGSSNSSSFTLPVKSLKLRAQLVVCLLNGYHNAIISIYCTFVKIP